MNPENSQFYFPPNKNELITVVIVGVLSGIVAILLAWITATYIIDPLICGLNREGFCAQPFTLSYNIFLIISGLAATGWFAYNRIFRPALVTLPTIIMFWSLPMVFSGILASSFFSFSLAHVALITMSYATFYWIVRIRSFLIVVLLWIVLTVGLRFMIIP